MVFKNFELTHANLNTAESSPAPWGVGGGGAGAGVRTQDPHHWLGWMYHAFYSFVMLFEPVLAIIFCYQHLCPFIGVYFVYSIACKCGAILAGFYIHALYTVETVKFCEQ